MTVTDAPSADAAAFCAALVREHDFGRYAATLFVSPEIRRALLSLYAFNVEIVRVRDQVTQPLPEILQRWIWPRERAAGTEATNPVNFSRLLCLRCEWRYE